MAEFENKRLILTGVTGAKSGGAFAEKLGIFLRDNPDCFSKGIRALVRSSSNPEKLRSALPGVEVMAGDFGDEAFLNRAMEGGGILLHIAGIFLSLPLVRAAVRQGVERIILVHTTGIYSKYKAAGENYRQIDDEVTALCQQAGIPLTILRPTMIYGNLTDHNLCTFIRMVDRLPLMPVLRGARYSLQPVYYGDLSEAYLRVLLDPEHTADKNYILSGAEPILLREMFQEIGAQLGKQKVRFLNCPYWLGYGAAWGLYVLTLGRKDYREKVQRLCESRCYPHEDASRDFGYAPLPFAQGIRGEIQEYLAAKAAGKAEGAT